MGKDIQIKCIKTVFMQGGKDSGKIAFILGKTYDAKSTNGSEVEYYAIDELGNSRHYMDMNWIKKHFIITYEESNNSNLPDNVRKMLEDEADTLRDIIASVENSIEANENKLKDSKKHLANLNKDLEDVLSVLHG